MKRIGKGSRLVIMKAGKTMETRQMFADVDVYTKHIMLFNERKLEEARRASKEYQTAKKEQAKLYRRRRLTVLRWRLLALVGR